MIEYMGFVRFLHFYGNQGGTEDGSSDGYIRFFSSCIPVKWDEEISEATEV